MRPTHVPKWDLSEFKGFQQHLVAVMQAALALGGKWAVDWLQRLESESRGIVHPGVLEQPDNLRTVRQTRSKEATG